VPKCKLRVVLDRSGAIYTRGETITGRVVVKALTNCTCKSLFVGCQTLSYGQGGTKLGTVPSERSLFTGGWRAGDEASFSFELSAPVGPPTTRRPGNTTDWYVFASAKLSLLTSAGASAPFGLASNKGESVSFPPPQEPDPATLAGLASDRRKQAIIPFVVSLPFLVIGAVLFISGVVNLSASSPDPFSTPPPDVAGLVLVLGACLALVGFVIAGRACKSLVSKPKSPTLTRERLNARLWRAK